MSVLHVKRGEGSLPVYRQLSDAIRSEIQDYYKAGDLLPPETELALRYKVNRHTLRRAVDELVHDGIVIRRHGKGVFVLAPSIEYQIDKQTRFTETLETLGINPQSRVMRKQKLLAHGGIAKRLEIESGEEVIFLETLRVAEEKPFCISSHFIPVKGFEQVLENYNNGSLHQFIDTHCNIQLQRTESLISTVMPEYEDCSLLNMPRTLPILRVKSLNFNIKNKQPVEYVITRFRGDAAQLSILPK